MRRSYLDELSPTRGTDPALGRVPKAPVIAPTLGQGFDTTTIGFFGLAQVVAGNAQFPAVAILTVPEQIERAEVLSLAVVGHPMSMWMGNLWWTLTIRTGPLQEWEPTSRIDPTNTGITALAPTEIGAVRYSSYGSLANPKPIRIRLASRSVLSLQVYGRGLTSTIAANVVPFTVYVRTVGMVHYSRSA